MEITISLDKIQNGIMQLTAILGRNRQDMKIAVTQDNLPAIGIYIGEAVTEAENELRRHLSDSNTFSIYKNESTITISIKDNVRNAKAIINSITGTLELYLIHYTISRWIGTIESLSNLAASYQDSAAGYLDKIKQLIVQKENYTIYDIDYKKRSESKKNMLSAAEHSFEQRESNNSSMLSAAEHSFEQRESNNLSTDGNSTFFDNEVYYNRFGSETDMSELPVDKRNYRIRSEAKTDMLPADEYSFTKKSKNRTDMLPADEYSFKKRSESKKDIFESNKRNYKIRSENKREMLSPADNIFKEREKNIISTDGNSTLFDNEVYRNRKRDLNPTGRANGAWPNDTLLTKDNYIIADEDNNILVSQPNNNNYYENNN